MTTCWRCGLKVDERPTGSKQWADYHAHPNYCIDMLRAENERLRAAATSVVEAYDFWDADQYERDGPGREIEELREVLGGKRQAALDAAGGANE